MQPHRWNFFSTYGGKYQYIYAPLFVKNRARN